MQVMQKLATEYREENQGHRIKPFINYWAETVPKEDQRFTLHGYQVFL